MTKRQKKAFRITGTAKCYRQVDFHGIPLLVAKQYKWAAVDPDGQISCYKSKPVFSRTEVDHSDRYWVPRANDCSWDVQHLDIYIRYEGDPAESCIRLVPFPKIQLKS